MPSPRRPASASEPSTSLPHPRGPRRGGVPQRAGEALRRKWRTSCSPSAGRSDAGLDGPLRRLHDDQARMADALRAVIVGTPYAQSRDRLYRRHHDPAPRRAARTAPYGRTSNGRRARQPHGVSLAAGEPAQRDQAGRLTRPLMDGLAIAPVRHAALTRPKRERGYYSARVSANAQPVVGTTDSARSRSDEEFGDESEVSTKASALTVVCPDERELASSG